MIDKHRASELYSSGFQEVIPKDADEGQPGGVQRTWVNLLIHDDSLSGLRSLIREYNLRGQVRLVYIDPPFATNQDYRIGVTRTSTISSSRRDSVAYQDRLKGMEYLAFLKERLVLLKELLTDDGSIYVHTDYKIGHYVKVLMDEVFGISNFRNDISRIKCNPKNFRRKGYGNIKDMILFYSKADDFLWNEPMDEMSQEDIIRLFPKIDRDGRRYTTTPLHAPGETRNGSTGQKWKGVFPPSGRHWRVPPDELTKLDNMGLIEWSSTGNPRKKIYAEEKRQTGKKRQDIWQLKDPPNPSYPTQKNLEMLKAIIGASSNDGDIVLDCFCGSGTTLIAAELAARRWIGVDNSWEAISIFIKRIKELKDHRPYMVFKVK